MRITENMKFGSVQRSLSSLRSRHATLTNQVTTGRKVLAPSDDPVAAAKLMRINARASRTEDYQKTISAVRADITMSEGNLSEASQLMVRAHELAIQGANDALSPNDRSALAVEVASLKEQLLATANGRGQRGYLFAGSQTATPPFDANGVYQGDDIEHEVEISFGVRTRVSVTGAAAFTAAGGTDAFAALDALHAALVSNEASAISATLGDIEASRAQMVRVQGQSGLIMNRLDTAEEALSVTALELTRQDSEAGDVDPFAAISELTQLSTTLEQAIAVARRTLTIGQDLF
jgi:flagellar hook-associated protein 3 FlgL